MIFYKLIAIPLDRWKLQENLCFSRPKGISILNCGTCVVVNYRLFSNMRWCYSSRWCRVELLANNFKGLTKLSICLLRSGFLCKIVNVS